MRKKSKYLSKNILLFSISSFLPKLFVFLLVPLYTTFLTTEQFGFSDLITTTTSLLIPIFSLDIQDSVMRFVMEKKNKSEDILSISILINLFGFLFVSIILFIVYYLRLLELPLYFFLYTAILFFLNSIYNNFTMFCKGIDKVKHIVVASTLLSLSTILLNIVFLAIFKYGIHGHLIAIVLGYLISDVYLVFFGKLFENVNLVKINKPLLKEMVLYSLPLIFSVIAWWINTASDRYIISLLIGVSASGLYAMSYKIPSILNMFYGVFSQAWSISAIKEYNRDDEDGFIGNIFTNLNVLLIILCSILMISNVYISKVLYKGEFFYAWRYIPPLLYSIVFYANAMFMGNILTAVKDTKYISLSTIAGALVNTILNIILINLIGIYGAAIATLVGYFIIYLMRNYFIKKYIKMKYNKKNLYVSLVLLFIQMIFAIYGNKYLIPQIIILIILLFIYKNNIMSITKQITSIISKRIIKK